MNRTNFEHLFVALIIQAIVFLMIGNLWWGVVLAGAIFFTREHAQREYKLGDPSKLVGYEAFDVWRWKLDPVLDFVVPVAGTLAVAVFVYLMGWEGIWTGVM